MSELDINTVRRSKVTTPQFPANRGIIEIVRKNSDGVRDKRAWLALNEWRRTILSDIGPPMSLTRFVLLTLAVYSDCNLYAFPSINQLESDTHLARRTLFIHLKEACNKGWIERYRAGYRHQRWWNNVYHLTLPRCASDALHTNIECV